MCHVVEWNRQRMQCTLQKLNMTKMVSHIWVTDCDTVKQIDEVRKLYRWIVRVRVRYLRLSISRSLSVGKQCARKIRCGNLLFFVLSAGTSWENNTENFNAVGLKVFRSNPIEKQRTYPKQREDERKTSERERKVSDTSLRKLNWMRLRCNFFFSLALKRNEWKKEFFFCFENGTAARFRFVCVPFLIWLSHLIGKGCDGPDSHAK